MLPSPVRPEAWPSNSVLPKDIVHHADALDRTLLALLQDPNLPPWKVANSVQSHGHPKFGEHSSYQTLELGEE